jgi:hypothetical protein
VSAAGIVLLVVVCLLLLLAAGGALARRRQLEETESDFREHLDAVNRDLATAHAADRGWDQERLESVARAAWLERSGGREPDSITLWEVVDHPGTDHDQAVYRITGDGAEAMITLGRTGDRWHAEPGGAPAD